MLCVEQHLWYAGAVPEGVVQAGSPQLPGDGTEGERAPATEAQHAQREPMLASQHSLNDNQQKLVDTREAMQQSHPDAVGTMHRKLLETVARICCY